MQNLVVVHDRVHGLDPDGAMSPSKTTHWSSGHWYAPLAMFPYYAEIPSFQSLDSVM